ncbi:uncharacterized protein LOC128211044 [Mya arenaria]|nr:uncharacterized protein LOC128211044 [Mya arenaria]
METIFDKTMEFKQKLGIEINQFKREHISCGATITYLDSLTLEHFVNIQQPSLNAENLIFGEYMRLSVVEYLTTILTSTQAQECCVAVPDVHHHLRHRVLSKWRQHVSGEDIAVLERSCMIRADIVVNLGRDCSDMRNLVYVLLRHVEREIDGSILTLDFLRG